jgi:aminoglycoside phosphotransferase (APT) family kinase protein
VRYASPPRALTGGFVTDVYAFELSDAPDEWSGPLVLRVYPPTTQALDVRRERCAQDVVAGQGVPAPRVVACEDEPATLDAPFMVMARLPGRVQLAIDFPRVLIEIPKLFTMHHRHAEAMRMVHRLDAQPLLDAFAAAGIDRRAAGPDHWLDVSERSMDRWNLDGLSPGLEWLRANRPPDPTRLSICHGDFFGGNILEAGRRITGILDWNLVTVADAAFDVGGQMAVSEMSPIVAPLPIRLAATGIGQLLARGLRRAYPVSDLDPDAVRYYAVMRAFTEMAYKLAAQTRVRETGVPERMPTWRPAQCARYILDRTGVSVEL